MFHLLLSLIIIDCIPVAESSRVLMKKSLMSDIKFVKQKKQSASANSEKPYNEWLINTIVYNPTFPFTPVIRCEDIVDRTDDLIHPLDKP